MPIPFLLAGLGVAAGVLGAGGHLSAKETNERAQRIVDDAQELYNDAKRTLEISKKKTEDSLMNLGYAKKKTLDTSMRVYLDAQNKIRHLELGNSAGMNELVNFGLDEQGELQMREMTDIYSATIQSGATGAAAGAVLALAANGSLPLVTGGLASAGSALLAGEVGAAAGIAGSALSFGAAMTPLAAVAAPVLFFTGLSASMKADENLEKANTMYAQAEAAAEKMKVSQVMCAAIAERADMFNNLLQNLDSMFAECSALMAAVIRKREGRFFKKKLTIDSFSQQDRQLMFVTGALAKAVKTVIDTPILSANGELTEESAVAAEATVARLPGYSDSVALVKNANYGVKPNVQKMQKYAGKSNASTAGGVGSILPYVLAVILAEFFSVLIAGFISTDFHTFLFLPMSMVNGIALWILIFMTILVLAGKVKSDAWKAVCLFTVPVCTSVLYVQFCWFLEWYVHHFILSGIAFLILKSIFAACDDSAKDFMPTYFTALMYCLYRIPKYFWIYALFTEAGEPESIYALIITVIVYCVRSFRVAKVLL